MSENNEESIALEATGEEQQVPEGEEQPEEQASDSVAPEPSVDEAEAERRTGEDRNSSKQEVPEIKPSTVVYAGRRKTAVARVRILPGAGRVFVNGMFMGDYFTSVAQEWAVIEPLRVAGVENRVDVIVNVRGGGKSGQAEATRLGIAKALCELNEEIAKKMRKGGFLARDPREKERRKYGLKKARKAPQYSKR